MTAQVLSRSNIKLSASCFPSSDNTLCHAKRYAMYIPQSFFENARKALAQMETESTWEFSALISSSESLFSESTPDLPKTPAQEIAIRYRAGMPVCFDGDGSQSDILIDVGASTHDDSSAVTFYSLVEYPECPSDDTLMVEITQTEIKLPDEQAYSGLSKTLEKAVHSANPPRGFREASSKTSQNPNILRTMVNRMFQLHSHDVPEGCVYYNTSHPDLQFGARRRRRMLWPPSPRSYENRPELQGSIQRGFRSIITDILSKLSCHQ